MKIVFLVLLFAASALAEPGYDGSFWQDLPRAHRLAWADGWLEGTVAGQAIFDARGNARVKNWHGTTCNELADGITQFYAGDYRNLKVRITVAAIIVMDYSRGGMPKAQMEAFVAKMRELSVSDSH